MSGNFFTLEEAYPIFRQLQIGLSQNNGRPASTRRGQGHGMDAVRLVERIGPCGKLASNGRGYSLIKGRGNEKQIKKQKRGHHRGPDHTV